MGGYSQASVASSDTMDLLPLIFILLFSAE